MAQERVRIDDQFRDSTGEAISGQNSDKAEVLGLAADEVPDTTPTSTTESTTLTYTVAAKAATADLTATAAVVIPDDNGTVTAVTYTPAGNQAAPSSGNSRTWTLAGSEGTIASLAFISTSSALATGVPVSFTVSHAAISEETLTLASAHGGSSGVADPGGTLSVTYTI